MRIAAVASALSASVFAGPSKRGKDPEPPAKEEIPFGEPYALGGLGAQGFVRKDHILISGVDADSPAATAGVAKGEKLVGVRRAGADLILFRDSPDSPLSQLVTELTRAQAKGATIELVVERGEKLARLKYKPERVKGHAPRCPKKCARCEGYVREALGSLAKAGGGMRFSGDAGTVESSIRGLAFLASGVTLAEGEHAKPLQECVTAVLRGVTDACAEGRTFGGPMCNWSLGFGGLFLAEVYAQHGEQGLRYPGSLYPSAQGGWGAPPSEGTPFADLLGRVARRIAAQQEASGGWAHGGEVGKPNSLGYIEVQACGNWCLAALGRMRQAGVAVPPEAIEKGVSYAKQCSSGNGGISYSAKNKGIPQIGRTGATLFAFWCCDATSDRLYADMQRYMTANLERMPEGHASPTMHFLSCGLGFRALGISSEAWGKFWEEYLPKMESLRRPDGTFALWPSDVGNDPKWKGMIPEKQLPDLWPTAVHALLLQAPGERVFRPIKKRKKDR